MLKLKRLKVEKLGDVAPCDLAFNDGLNVILGPNGSGKTSLLNLISRVLRSRQDELPESYSLQYRLESGLELTVDARIQGEPALRHLPPDTDVERRMSQPPTVHHAEVQLGGSDPRLHLGIVAHGSEVTVRPTDKEEQPLPNLGTLGGSLIIPSMILTSLYTIRKEIPPLRGLYPYNVFRFDESLEMFKDVFAQRELTVMPPHAPRVMIYARSSSPGFTASGLIPSELFQVLLGLSRSASPLGPTISSTDLPLLSLACRLMGFASGEARLNLIERGPDAGGTEVSQYGDLNIWFTRRDGSSFPQSHLSYGQKRLLTFLYYCACNDDIVIADELVNGLHHSWIDESFKILGDRQVFLTSQNPLLLDHLWFTDAEQVRRTFILCDVDTTARRDRMVWRNLSLDEAELFYRAYQTGIESVAEILKTRGFW